MRDASPRTLQNAGDCGHSKTEVSHYLSPVFEAYLTLHHNRAAYFSNRFLAA